jgi:hypothetical protein
MIRTPALEKAFWREAAHRVLHARTSVPVSANCTIPILDQADWIRTRSISVIEI